MFGKATHIQNNADLKGAVEKLGKIIEERAESSKRLKSLSEKEKTR